MSKVINNITIFVASLVIVILYTFMAESEVITAICTVASTLLGVWGIVHQAFRQRDKEIKQLLKSEQEFKDYKESASHSFLAFGQQVANTEERLDKTLDRIDRKLDKQNTVISEQEETLARLDERTKN